MKDLKTTRSICPECFKTIDAIIFEENGQVFLKKTCPNHGLYEDLYWSSYEDYLRAQQYSVIGHGIDNPQTTVQNGHPFDCGLCPNHRSHTALAIIDVTNRCNLRCPICFANASVTGYLYEPTLEQIEKMLKQLRNLKPIPATALQFSGGEPTVREDLVTLIEMAKKVGFEHIEVNSNGVKFAKSVDYCRSLLEAGVSTIYLQFDGVTSQPYIATRGQDLLKTKFQAIKNLRAAGWDSIVLVPTIVKGVNDDQLGAIIQYAAENFDVIRCVNFQPVSITGRIESEKRKEMRITIPDCMKLVEDQTDGQIKTTDFFPVPIVAPISNAVGAIKKRRYIEFTVHEHCGMATFVFVENKKLIPITQYANVKKFMDSMKKVSETASKGSTTKAKLQMLSSSLHYTDFKILRQLISGVLREGSYGALGTLMRNVLMIGMMHFQDPYNLDLQRLEKCAIHYAVPDGRIIPFCAMNAIYRTEIEKKFGTPLICAEPDKRPSSTD
ncbi:MAG: radical SAM protein [Candidatus Bathyarchaeota archaeon]|nr:MAG: radical SAM protein [Candidatus Bathyarchaeota archaeon]